MFRVPNSDVRPSGGMIKAKGDIQLGYFDGNDDEMRHVNNSELIKSGQFNQEMPEVSLRIKTKINC